MIAGGVGAGIFGSLLGLGGGVLIVPLLTLGFGLPLREAVGVSLVAVIVTSSASAGVYLQRHVANLRLGMTLELFTAIGALVGGLVAFALSRAGPGRPVHGPARLHRVHDGPPARRAPARSRATRTPPASERRRQRSSPRRAGRCQATDRPRAARRMPSATCGSGIAGSLFAGVVSALLGVGGGLDQGPADEPRDGRPAARRDGHQQPDDRGHGLGQRDHLPAPRRDRPVRRRPDRGRRVRRRLDRVADRAPGRRAGAADAVRGRAPGHGLADGRCGPSR